MLVRAGIYVRISSDPEGLRLGVARQREDCLAICEARRWEVVDVYEDNDQSAYQGRARPEYQRLLSDLRAGAINAVVVWAQDRLTRHPKELEEFFEVIDEVGDVELATVSGDRDLSTPEGQSWARIEGAMARRESDDKSRRIRRKHEQLAADGKVSGGGFRPFGFESDRRSIRESEAVLIREAARRILAGETQSSVLRDWEAQGVTTTAGMPWTLTSFNRMMRSPRVAGLREHRGEIAGRAEWEGIVDETTHRQLRAKLKGTGAGKANRQRKYLLTGGIAVCGLCSTALAAQPNKGNRSMVCPTGPGRNGCGRIRIAADPIEEYVGQLVIEALDGPMLLEAIRADEQADNQDAELAERIATLQASLEQAGIDHYSGEIERAEYFAVRKALQADIESLRSKLSRNGRSRILTGLPTGRTALEKAWAQGDIGWRRALVSAVLDRVKVSPAERGRRQLDPGRLTLTWNA